MNRIIIIAILSTLFTGCAQIGKYAQNRFDPMGSAKEECQQLGLQVGTPNYANCVTDLYRSKQSVNVARYNSASSDLSPAPALPRSTMTNCRQVGSSLSCTTY